MPLLVSDHFERLQQSLRSWCMMNGFFSNQPAPIDFQTISIWPQWRPFLNTWAPAGTRPERITHWARELTLSIVIADSQIRGPRMKRWFLQTSKLSGNVNATLPSSVPRAQRKVSNKSSKRAYSLLTYTRLTSCFQSHQHRSKTLTKSTDLSPLSSRIPLSPNPLTSRKWIESQTLVQRM